MQSTGGPGTVEALVDPKHASPVKITCGGTSWGRKLKVLHNGKGVTRYVCSDASVNHGHRNVCVMFDGGTTDCGAFVTAAALIALALVTWQINLQG